MLVEVLGIIAHSQFQGGLNIRRTPILLRHLLIRG